jgi:3-oxoacyl-[acyl-carrier protein] reductase
LVTGSSRGIGRAIALRLARDGWSVAIHGASPSEALEAVRGELGTSCSGSYTADLGDARHAPLLVERALADGPLHALVNNAGIYLQMNFLAASEEQFDANLHRTMAVNFEAPLRLMRAAARHFREQGGGKVLNVASRVGFKGEAGAATYSASKAALINVTRALAVVFGIAPGWVETAMARAGMTERLPAILADIPLGRVATPEDCAAVAAFLLSPEAEYLSGVVVDINGASYFH